LIFAFPNGKKRALLNGEQHELAEPKTTQTTNFDKESYSILFVDELI
jgi:hypothetical protein